MSLRKPYVEAVRWRTFGEGHHELVDPAFPCRLRPMRSVLRAKGNTHVCRKRTPAFPGMPTSHSRRFIEPSAAFDGFA